MSEQGFGPLKKDNVDALIEFLAPYVDGILARIDVDEFTTVQLIDAMQTDPAAEAAYQETVRRWGEDEVSSKMVVHGQVIPTILRMSPRVEWAGFAYDEHDPYAVPAWWKMIGGDR